MRRRREELPAAELDDDARAERRYRRLGRWGAACDPPSPLHARTRAEVRRLAAKDASVDVRLAALEDFLRDARQFDAADRWERSLEAAAS